MSEHSFANITEVHVSRYDITLVVDFCKSILHGSIVVECRSVSVEVPVTKVILDTWKLKILDTTLLDGGGGDRCTLDYTLGEHDEVLGSALDIKIPESEAEFVRSTFSIRINFQTSEESEGIQWLSKQQTAGKRYPFLYTQCQPIHCRSIIPSQDNPEVKAPFAATVYVPNPLTAVMGAIRTVTFTSEEVPLSVDRTCVDMMGFPDNCWNVVKFVQNRPIPSYLFALAVGDLHCRPLGPRSVVWTEPSFLDRSEHEFADTEQLLRKAESIIGLHYDWHRYDLLVLPPGFPLGAMENPCTTFVTPTLLAGDRSLVDVIAHEISHSWSGNLVTNKNWRSFWLNEGVTVYLERKIIAELHDPRLFSLLAVVGHADLKRSIEYYGEDHPWTALTPVLSAEDDPDDAYSSVPYEKGFNVVAYMEHLLGEKDMYAFLRHYFTVFRDKSVDALDFIECFKDFCVENEHEIPDVDWDHWLFAPGYPPELHPETSELADEAQQLAEYWSTCDVSTCEPPVPADQFKQWSTPQKVAFLDYLVEHADPPPSSHSVQKLGMTYGIPEIVNSEIKFRWLLLCIESGVHTVVPNAIEFITTQGRMKFVRPLYRALFEKESLKELAVDTFVQNWESYHPIAVKGIAQDLEVDVQTLREDELDIVNMRKYRPKSPRPDMG